MVQKCNSAYAYLPGTVELVRGLRTEGEELQNKKEVNSETGLLVYAECTRVVQKCVIQCMHAYHLQQSWCMGLYSEGEKLQDRTRRNLEA